jgi:tRNA threonylcarbamoyladenosine biosynthesis protein TsaE
MSPDARITRSADETARLGEALAPVLERGDVIALMGGLGAGKTRFVAGLARGLACRARVRSPSFAIVNEYHGRLLLLHLDLYRLDPRDVDGLGLGEYLERGVLAVEWGERLSERDLAGALVIRFEPRDGDTRLVTAEAVTGRGLRLLEAWTALPSDLPGAGAPA